MSKETKIDFEKPYPDEEKMRRGVLYWQNAPQERPEDRCKFYIKKGRALLKEYNKIYSQMVFIIYS